MGILFRQSWRTFMVFFSSCRDFIPTVRIMYFKFTMKFSRLIKKSSLSDVAKQNWKAWQVLFKVVQLKVHTQIAFSLSHSDAVDIWWLRSIKCLVNILCSVGVLYFLLLYYIISKSFCQPFSEKGYSIFSVDELEKIFLMILGDCEI